MEKIEFSQALLGNYRHWKPRLAVRAGQPAAAEMLTCLLLLCHQAAPQPGKPAENCPTCTADNQSDSLFASNNYQICVKGLGFTAVFAQCLGRSSAPSSSSRPGSPTSARWRTSSPSTILNWSSQNIVSERKTNKLFF